MDVYTEELFFTNNSIGDAIGQPYKTTVPIKEFRDFLNSMIEKGADTLYICPYGNSNQKMGVKRSRGKDEILSIKIDQITKEFSDKLDALKKEIDNQKPPLKN